MLDNNGKNHGTLQEAKWVSVAVAGDIHATVASRNVLRGLLGQMARAADIVALCGDLLDYGTIEEAHVLAEEIRASVRVPVLAVYGNHDYEMDQVEEVTRILTAAGVKVLDGGHCEIKGLGFAGVKGFCGGFAGYELAPWGELGIKTFVREGEREALKLESGLRSLRTRHRIALLHYAPIRETVIGEPPEIFPFLGSSHLEGPINRCHASAAFHGHAHPGQPYGHTGSGVPVFNVAVPLLRRRFPSRAPFRVVSFDLASPHVRVEESPARE